MKTPSFFNLFPLFPSLFQPPDLNDPLQPPHLSSQNQHSTILLCNILACISLFIFQMFHFYAFSCLNVFVMWILIPQILLAFIFLHKHQMNLALFFTLSFIHSTGLLFAKSYDSSLLAACFLMIIPSLTFLLKPSAKIFTVSIFLCIVQSIYYSVLIDHKFYGLYIEEQSLEIKLLTNGLPV